MRVFVSRFESPSGLSNAAAHFSKPLLLAISCPTKLKISFDDTGVLVLRKLTARGTAGYKLAQ